MTQPSREAIYAALFALVSAQTVYPWVTTSRRLRLWGDVPIDQRPALFQYEGDPDRYEYQSKAKTVVSQQRTIHAKLFAYTNAKDPTIVASTHLSNILDALDAALLPTGADTATGQNTLGGLVQNCWIEAIPVRDPGDLDGDGVLIVDVGILLP